MHGTYMMFDDLRACLANMQGKEEKIIVQATMLALYGRAYWDCFTAELQSGARITNNDSDEALDAFANIELTLLFCGDTRFVASILDLVGFAILKLRLQGARG